MNNTKQVIDNHNKRILHSSHSPYTKDNKDGTGTNKTFILYLYISIYIYIYIDKKRKMKKKKKHFEKPQGKCETAG